ncbi:hypothetical protein M885DRAFT_514345 [Pelagophyceae sp. CCMP2097]|nr:hypothetical protein M885DRAFT_514345 [Pelagophyceae sp. CCMP2097]|mmetsp:Transcript_31304/g.105383  ORF Transcript_31304/g.105383 Transcript_31304/m.105383 type:complete len:642 (-) Transcript_31304:1681-3606(-)
MPTVGVKRDDLHERLGKVYTQDDFEELCFEFGVELDDVTSEADAARDFGLDEAAIAAKGLSTDVIYKIDVPANRYDLLCLEGFARALRVFLGLEKSPVYELIVPPVKAKITVDCNSVDGVRPFVCCAILRGVSFADERVYKSFIELQEKLHQNICRRRTLVAIGTHDLSMVQGPFTYACEAPEGIEFVPLTEPEGGKSWKAADLLQHYETQPESKHLKPYAQLISSMPKLPVIRDATGKVLSLPPVINGKHSRIRRETTDVFIECTATDETKANVVCDTVVTMFSEYCGFTVEAVDVEYVQSGKVRRTVTTPALHRYECSASLDVIRGTIGLTAEMLPAEMACELCERMQLAPASYDANTGLVTVSVPPTRSDIMHAVDVVEDVAIAYGFNRVPETLPKTATVGAPQPINNFADLLREEVARAGYIEMLTHGLCRNDENFALLRHPEGAEAHKAVVLSNPASEDFEIVRTTLLVGALKTLCCNKRHAVRNGLKLFEVSDVVVRSESDDVGAHNVRHVVATYTGATAGFEVIHGLLDRIMACAQIPPSAAYAAGSLKPDDLDSYATAAKIKACGVEYHIEPVDDATFFPGRCAQVVVTAPGGVRTIMGKLGVVHPVVLKNFDVDYPTSSIELDVELLMGACH